jgi:DNA-binding XRE family transcriptional regulator
LTEGSSSDLVREYAIAMRGMSMTNRVSDQDFDICTRSHPVILPEREHVRVIPPGNALGSVIRAVRQARGLSEAELSTAIGCQPRYIVALESGYILAPSYSIILGIWTTLGVDPAEASRDIKSLRASESR